MHKNEYEILILVMQTTKLLRHINDYVIQDIRDCILIQRLKIVKRKKKITVQKVETLLIDW